jgi:hypothetical protein
VLLLGSLLACQSDPYAGTYIGQFVYDWAEYEGVGMVRASGTAAMSVTVVLEYMGEGSSDFLGELPTHRITDANVSDPYFGTGAGLQKTASGSIARLPKEPPGDPSASYLVITFANGTELSAGFRGGPGVAITSDARILSNPLPDGHTWRAGAASFPSASRIAVDTKSWALTASAR